MLGSAKLCAPHRRPTKPEGRCDFTDMNSRGQAASSHKSGIKIVENPGEISRNGAGNSWEIGQTSDALWTLMTIHGDMPI
jgi:hypothetical protein